MFRIYCNLDCNCFRRIVWLWSLLKAVYLDRTLNAKIDKRCRKQVQVQLQVHTAHHSSYRVFFLLTLRLSLLCIRSSCILLKLSIDFHRNQNNGRNNKTTVKAFSTSPIVKSIHILFANEKKHKSQTILTTLFSWAPCV